MSSNRFQANPSDLASGWHNARVLAAAATLTRAWLEHRTRLQLA